jgi:hypothetical protein
MCSSNMNFFCVGVNMKKFILLEHIGIEGTIDTVLKYHLLEPS